MRRALLLALAALLVVPSGAAAHHSLKIREVRATATQPQLAFVELQAYRQGQNGIAGSEIWAYGPLGLRHVVTLGHEPPNGENQRTILIGDTGVAGADFTDALLGDTLSPTSGAVCFPEAVPADCVGWGSYPAGGSVPFPGVGALAPAIPEGLSLTRTISRGCRTGLDPADDTNNSAADFSLTSPTPRPNAAPALDRECVPCDGVDATIIGTNGKDVIRGTKGRDVIAALAGTDVVRGLGGNDLICGGLGKDRLFGGAGRDKLIGERGRDICRGGKGRDTSRSCEVRVSA